MREEMRNIRELVWVRVLGRKRGESLRYLFCMRCGRDGWVKRIFRKFDVCLGCIIVFFCYLF